MTARLLISCGEPSGDLYAGALVRELRARHPDLSVAGLGGPQLAAAGGELLADYRGLAVTGITEVLPKLSDLLAARKRLVDWAREHRPDALVVIDYPDFNLRLARSVKKLGIPVISYISPQIWAWRPGRLRTIKQVVDRVLVIFPFEEAIYERGGVPVEFVGHPLIDLVPATPDRRAILGGFGLDPDARTVALLPGSRANEVRHILPDLLRASDLLAARVPGVQFVVARAPNLDDALFDEVKASTRRTAVVEGQTDAVLAAADVALTASGTATVQTALHDTPMVVVYRLSPLTYTLGRRFVKVDTFAMVNLIAGERLVPELIQDAFTPEAVAREAESMLIDAARVATIRAGLARVRSRLGGPGASRRAAEAIVRAMAPAAVRV
ncbi:MAG: lipid-A-disaccharide synthase [Vicinamibacterales bacterium]